MQKALRLLHNSNPILFEWNSSPIVYRTSDEWKQIADIINSYFVKKSGLYHYLSTAKRNYREYLKGDTVRLKKYFYVLRPWILSEQTSPPMLFFALMDKCLDKEIKPDVQKLLKLKMESPEISEGNRIDSINAYIDSNIENIEGIIKDLPEEREQDWSELNGIFLSLVK